MPAEISKSKFEAKALEQLRQVETTGEPLIVTDNGRPTLEIRRYRPGLTANPLEILRGSVLRYDDPTGPVAD